MIPTLNLNTPQFHSPRLSGMNTAPHNPVQPHQRVTTDSVRFGAVSGPAQYEVELNVPKALWDKATALSERRGENLGQIVGIGGSILNALKEMREESYYTVSLAMARWTKEPKKMLGVTYGHSNALYSYHVSTRGSYPSAETKPFKLSLSAEQFVDMTRTAEYFGRSLEQFILDAIHVLAQATEIYDQTPKQDRLLTELMIVKKSSAGIRQIYGFKGFSIY